MSVGVASRRRPSASLHAGDGAAAFGVRVGDAEGVGGRAVADDLAVDRGAALRGVLELFEDDHRRRLRRG